MGLDPASKMDFFGIVVHALPTGRFPMPQLVTMQAVTHTSYLAMMEALKRDMFRRFPPYYIVVDYNTEKTFSQILQRDYGDERLELVTFGNQAKQMLKDDGLAILKQGYTFPDAYKQTNMKQRKYLIDLVKQIKQEQMLVTRTGKITFDHPQGEHNDLATAWELSIHGCLKFMINAKSGPAAWSENRNYKDDAPDIPEGADPSSEVKLNPANKITYEYSYQPS